MWDTIPSLIGVKDIYCNQLDLAKHAINSVFEDRVLVRVLIEVVY